MKHIKFVLAACLFGAAVLTACTEKDDKPATKPVIEITPGENDGTYKVDVTGDWNLTNVVITVKAGDQTTTPVDQKTFSAPTAFTYEGTVEYPAKVYAAVVTVTATNEKGLSNTADATVSIHEPAVDPDAAVLYNFAKEFATVSRKAWNDNVASGKIHQHTEAGGLIEDPVHYIPDSWSDPDQSGKWTTYTVAGKTYSVEQAYEIATRAFLMLMGYDVAAYTGGASATTLPELKPAATLTAPIPEPIEGKTWSRGSLPYNESGNTAVGGAQTANGGPLRKGQMSAGTAACQANVCDLGLMINYARRHFTYVYNNNITIANMCGYNGGQYEGYYGTFCAKRFYMALVNFYEYMMENNLMDASSIPATQEFNCALYGNEKWD